jgi:hypothetical protein
MIVLNQLPNNWNSITVPQYLEIKDLESEDLIGTELLLEQVAILLNTDTEDPNINSIDIDELFEILDRLKFLANEPPSNHVRINTELKPIDFNELVLGEFIDIEHYITDPMINIHIILAIIHKKWSKDEWDNDIYEPYNYDINKRAEEFIEIPVTTAIFWIRKYIVWKEEFMKTYENLFEDPDVGKEFEEEQEELVGYDLVEYKKTLMIQRQKAKFGWENTIYGLAKGDITKFNDIFGQKLILVFNILNMKTIMEA